MKKNKKERCEDSEMMYFEFGKKVFETKGRSHKVFKDMDEFKRSKLF
jgi:hypothetical protein